MKSDIRWSKASRSTKRKVERALCLGWEPGLRVRDFVFARKSRRVRQGGEHAW
jgi:hypothetical protein